MAALVGTPNDGGAGGVRPVVRAGRPGGRPAARAAVAAALAVGAAACASGGPLWAPSEADLARAAPDSFVVEMVTSEGPLHITLHRDWSPRGVDRAYHLFRHDFYAGARIYRMVPGFVAQFGFSGTPHLDSIWGERDLPDEPVVASNTRGTVSFARSGPESRSFTLFVNLADNPRLDTLEVAGIVGYPPIGRLDDDLDALDGFYGAYADPAPRQDSIRAFGNEYLRRHFPQLDSIVSTRVVREWR